MIDGEEIFHQVNVATDREAAVKGLTMHEARALYGWLLQNYCIHGATGAVLGLMLVEAGDLLFGKTQDGKTQESREEGTAEAQRAQRERRGKIKVGGES